jgi:PAS domain S-box-containing protein
MTIGHDRRVAHPLYREEDARQALEFSFDGIWTLDSELRTTFVNARMAEMLGYSPEAMLRRQVYDFLFPQDVPAAEAAVNRRKNGVREELEFRFRRHDGSELWARVATAPILAGEGDFGGVVAILSDITHRRQAEESLRAREKELLEAEQLSQQLAAIVESSDDAIVSKDLNGVIRSWNRGATRIFGFTPEEAIGQRILILIPPELHAEEDVILERLRAGKRIDHYETERLTKDGRRLYVSVTISPIRDASGRVIGASKIARDITERKRAEQVLLTSEKLASVGRLAATVAHEINNPLESVINLVYLARLADNRETVQQYLGTAEEELNRIAHLTKQTLGFYRERSERTRVHAGELLNQLAAVFSSKAQNKGVKIKLEILDDPEIAVDRGEFRQLFSNLLNNSIDACGHGGAVRVRVSTARRAAASAPCLRITVVDNGSGIKPADRAHVFEPFFTTKKEVGTGLGLWICKQIAEKYGGTVAVRSHAQPGRSWTAVSVFLPVIVPDACSALAPCLKKGA